MTTSGTPLHMTNLVGVAQRWGSVQIGICHFFAFFITSTGCNLDDLYIKTRVFGQGTAFWKSRQKRIPPYLAPKFHNFALQKLFFGINSGTKLHIRIEFQPCRF